jgi:tetratricopeptide (TPR) repeat protein
MRKWFGWVLAAALLAPAAANAQSGGGERSAAQREEARDHFQRGVALMQEGSAEAALAEFQRAYELHPARAILFNIGMCQKSLGRFTDAIRTLQRYLDEYREQASEAELEAVDAAIREMRAAAEPGAPGAAPRHVPCDPEHPERPCTPDGPPSPAPPPAPGTP